MYNIYDMNSGIKFIRKEDDDIDLDIDFDINKIRTNFIPIYILLKQIINIPKM